MAETELGLIYLWLAQHCRCKKIKKIFITMEIFFIFMKFLFKSLKVVLCVPSVKIGLYYYVDSEEFFLKKRYILVKRKKVTTFII